MTSKQAVISVWCGFCTMQQFYNAFLSTKHFLAGCLGSYSMAHVLLSFSLTHYQQQVMFFNCLTNSPLWDRRYVNGTWNEVSWPVSDQSVIGSAEIYLRAVHLGFFFWGGDNNAKIETKLSWPGSHQRSALLRSISVPYTWSGRQQCQNHGLCRNSSANSKWTFFTFLDEQKQNTKQ